ncbi:MAG TPA: SusD/RagB family nutrient-binding outer membrane lipoprotein [Leeuwenhoekiella sp.]|nr:SusD/RagB family nutrient-binding outer membrane lipoprotein [Leeuwenhoekiella sp.]
MNLYKQLRNLLFIGCIAFIGCDDYLDINENPNNPSEAPLAGLMTNSTFESAQNTFRMASISTNYVQYIASPNAGSSSDIMDPVDYSTTWSNMYNVMTDLSDLVAQAESSGANHYQGAAQIMLAYNLALTVDAWGDIPFSEGFSFGTLTPAYDDDAALYDEILSLLDLGIQNLSQPTDFSIGQDDFIYNGDPAQWVKLGYMLKARYFNHYSKTDSYDPNAVLAALENGFESNADDAKVTYFEEEFNPWASVARSNANLILGGWISEQFVQALDGTTFGVVDPRLPTMISTTDDGDYVGTENGAGRGNAPEAGARSVLELGDYYSSDLSPVLIATYAEQKFIEAEASFETDKSRSYNAYLAGIEANMQKLGIAQQEISTYLSNEVVSMGLDAFTKDAIFKEKWVALFLNPETWVDARRHDYQYEDFTLPANINPQLNSQFIRRLVYPNSEVSRNGRNVPDVTLLDQIFWDE